mmetsp:Transcript_8494/g.13380  ORF Transcript_8494/g.13380 Transcript_8494/m.13380 type:complete len:150 (+) Transcript_8494:211-660(+)
MTSSWDTPGPKHCTLRSCKKMGEILRMRDIINLRGNLETPDAYWEQRELEGLYIIISREFDLAKRISTLNAKLDVAHELVEVRRMQLAEDYKSRLVLWVIILICVTCLFKMDETWKAYKSKGNVTDGKEASHGKKPLFQKLMDRWNEQS